MLTSNALVDSDYYVSPLIPEPLSILGIDLVRERVQILNDREGLDIYFAGPVLNKVMYYRNCHSVQAPKLYGAQVGMAPRFQENAMTLSIIGYRIQNRC